MSPTYDPIHTIPSKAPSVKPTSKPSLVPTLKPSVIPSTIQPTILKGNSFLASQSLANVSIGIFNTTNGTLAFKLAILKSLNDSTINVGQIAILNITTAVTGTSRIGYRVYFNSVNPKATYNKLTLTLAYNINSGFFGKTFINVGEKLNVPNITDVVMGSYSIHVLDFASPPSTTPTFSPTSDPTTIIPSGSPTVYPSVHPSVYPTVKKITKPSAKPLYKYPSKKPTLNNPSTKYADSHPSKKPIHLQTSPSKKPLQHVDPSRKPIYSYPSKRPVYSYPTKKPQLLSKPDHKPVSNAKKPTKKPIIDERVQHIGNTATNASSAATDSGLSVGAYAGIALGALVVLGLIIFVWLRMNSREKNEVINLKEGQDNI